MSETRTHYRTCPICEATCGLELIDPLSGNAVLNALPVRVEALVPVPA
jgi:hypothetical protein